ncbi:MAG TPA: hypothetical protein VGF34_04785 [Stellaceae bacterium]
MTDIEVPLLVTPKRAQRMLDCGSTHYYDLVGAGIIRQRKIGRRAARAVYEDVVAVAEGRRTAEISLLGKTPAAGIAPGARQSGGAARDHKAPAA